MKRNCYLKELNEFFQMSRHVHSSIGYTCALPCKFYGFSCVVSWRMCSVPSHSHFMFGTQERTYHHFLACHLPLWITLQTDESWSFPVFSLSLDCSAFTKSLIWVSCCPWKLYSILSEYFCKVLEVTICLSHSNILKHRSSHSWISFGQMKVGLDLRSLPSWAFL